MFKASRAIKAPKIPAVGVKKTLDPLAKMKRAIPGFKSGGHVDHEVITKRIHCNCEGK